MPDSGWTIARRRRMARTTSTVVGAAVCFLAIGGVANAQVVAPAGVRAAFVHLRLASPSHQSRAAVTVGHSRQAHILLGLAGGLVIGASTGAIIGNQNAKRCHGESCQVEAALGGGVDVIVGGLVGMAVGGIVGAVWPVRE